MKKNYKDELRSRDVSWLVAHTRDLREKLARLQFDARSGKNANHKEIKNVRLEIATTLTFIHEKRNHV